MVGSLAGFACSVLQVTLGLQLGVSGSGTVSGLDTPGSAVGNTLRLLLGLLGPVLGVLVSSVGLSLGFLGSTCTRKRGTSKKS